MGNTPCASSGAPVDEILRLAERDRRDQRALSLQAVAGRMCVFVTVLSGETTEIMTEPTETVDRFKQRVAAVLAIEPHQQRLIFNGSSELREGTLSDYGIGEDARIQLVTTEEESAPVAARLEAAKELLVGSFVGAARAIQSC